MIRTWWQRGQARRQKNTLLRQYGAISWCPQCREILQGQAEAEEVDWQGGLCRYRFTCVCGCVSYWVYGAPVIFRVSGPDETVLEGV